MLFLVRRFVVEPLAFGQLGQAPRVLIRTYRGGVIVRPVPVYGFPEHVRVTVGTRAENERLVAALRTVRGEEGRGIAI